MEKLTIVKIGGKIIDDPALLSASLQKFARISGAKILVHGGGKIASGILERIGTEPKMVGGRRITDEETLNVVQMVYGGLINKNIVAELQAFDCNALGMSGADGASILAHKRHVDKIDYGFAGDVDEVNNATLNKIINCGLTPVFCALTHDGKGQMLNTNADTIATELAMALSGQFRVSALFTFEKKGVLENIGQEDSVINHLTKSLYKKLRTEGKINDGMIPKLDNVFRALEAGVEEIFITNWQNSSTGTRVTLL